MIPLTVLNAVKMALLGMGLHNHSFRCYELRKMVGMAGCTRDTDLYSVLGLASWCRHLSVDLSAMDRRTR